LFFTAIDDTNDVTQNGEQLYLSFAIAL
jgi:hypothetical protein